MQFSLYMFLIVFVMIVSFINCQPDHSHLSFCQIKNAMYPNEFLYTCRDRNMNDFNRKVYTNPPYSKYMNGFFQMGWVFEPVNDGQNNTYHLINVQYEEYLCASDLHLDVLRLRRKVNTVRINKYDMNGFSGDNKNDSTSVGNSLVGIYDYQNSCKWRLQSLSGGDPDKYMIWNVKFNEPLYAASFLFKMAKSNRRNVYLWHKKPDSLQFVWFINCFQNSKFD
jgi:hypothetical protein